jgi:hypothetical protein
MMAANFPNKQLASTLRTRIMACRRAYQEKTARYRAIPFPALFFLLLMAIPFPAPTAWAEGNPPAKPHPTKTKPKATAIRKISFDYRMQADGHNEFLILGDGPIKNYKTLRLANPPRLALDIPGVSLQGNTVELPINGPELSRIRIAHHPDKVRFVFDLAEGKNVRSRVIEQDKGLKVLLSLHPDQTPPGTAATTDAPASLQKTPSPASGRQLQTLASSDLEQLFGSQRVNVIFHKTPIREFAKYLSEKSGRRIEVSPDLALSVSLRFTEVPLHTLVNAAADTIGFVLRQDNERIILAPAEPLSPAGGQKKGEAS